VPGRGGVTRGRGDAELGLLGRTEPLTEEMTAKRLPPSARLSKEWTSIGVRRGEPKADAVREEATGASGDEGAGEAAWTRRLAPRHRAVVRRFFSEEEGSPR
jgi:hypothetical protein